VKTAKKESTKWYKMASIELMFDV